MTSNSAEHVFRQNALVCDFDPLIMPIWILIKSPSVARIAMHSIKRPNILIHLCLMSRSSKMVFSIAIIGAIIAALTLAPMSITGQKTAQTFTTHSGAIITTTGQILDPLYTESTLEFDPMEFLRNFEYGKVTHLEDGTVLREFTIIADDSHIMEISPGVFYNVWAFNGTVPGPTIRATEGDLVRIHFINNGSKPHTMHFHGIHAAEFDGVFEPVGPGGQFIYEWTAEPVHSILHMVCTAYVDPKESSKHVHMLL